MTRLSLTLIPPVTMEIYNGILNAIMEELKDVFRHVLIPIQHRVRILFETELRKTPEIRSLLGGSLIGEFGLLNPTDKVDAIISALINDIQMVPKKFRRSGGVIEGGFKLQMVDGSFAEILALPEAFQPTEKGEILPWLQWLLKEGDKIIIRDYSILWGPRSGSRTGLAIMIENKKGVWRVPPEFAGTINNNFITRTMDYIAPTIEKILEEEIGKVL